MTLTLRDGGAILGRITDLDTGSGITATLQGSTAQLVATGLAVFGNPGGRLTLTSGTPVTTSDVTSSTSIYYTPYLHNNIWLYTSGAWTHYTFAEITIALGTLTSATNYDVFLYDSGGVVTAKIGPAWSSATTRGTGAGTTELAQQDGAWVNNVAITAGPGAKAGLYVGSFRTISTTATADSGGDAGTSQVGAKRFLDNMYNRVPGSLRVVDLTDSWNYGTGTIRQADGAAGNMVEMLNGQPWEMVETRIALTWSGASNSARGMQVGFGLDSTSTFSGIPGTGYITSASALILTFVASYLGYPGLGYHYLSWNELGADGTSTFYGDFGSSFPFSGVNGWKLR